MSASTPCPPWCAGHLDDGTHFTASNGITLGTTEVFVDITQAPGGRVEVVITDSGIDMWSLEAAQEFHRRLGISLARTQQLVEETNGKAVAA